MRTFISRLLPILSLLIVFSEASGKEITVSGIVKDKDTGRAIENASLFVNGTNIGTVSNADGSFTLTFADSLLSKGIRAEQLGYKSLTIRGSELLGKRVIFSLPSTARMLDEIKVKGADPRALVEIALKKIPVNYPDRPNLFTAFYRETVRKGKRYIGVSEAIVDVYKRSYQNRNTMGDRVGIVKGRRLVSQNKNDTVAVKIIGGPAMPIVLDFVKNEDLLFNISELDNYEYKLEPMVMLDDRPQFVVSFRPILRSEFALHKGRLYIDQETIAFTKAEFALDMSDREKATRSILFKKPAGLRFKPIAMDFTVTYKYQDGKSYLNFISVKTRFTCDWKRRLFASDYTVCAEMVMVDRIDNPASTIPQKDMFRTKDIFYDKVDNFSDPDFWKDYNIIEPTESLEKAVRKLRR